MTARNKDFCVMVQGISVNAVDYVLVADDHTSWWTTRESYDQAVAAMGDLRSEDDEYREFCDMMVTLDPDIEDVLRDAYREIDTYA